MPKQPDASAIPTTEAPLFYTIEQIASRFEITKRTLRYYEEMGLLPPTTRTEGNYRRYTEADIERIARIKELRDLLGFSLNDIRHLLEADDERIQIRLAMRQETEPTSKLQSLERAAALITDQLQLIERKITGLEQMHTSLNERLLRIQQRQEELHTQIQADLEGD